MSSRSQRHRKCKVEQILSENELSESDDDDNDNKPSDYEIDVSEASFFTGPQKSNLRVNS